MNVTAAKQILLLPDSKRQQTRKPYQETHHEIYKLFFLHTVTCYLSQTGISYINGFINDRGNEQSSCTLKPYCPAFSGRFTTYNGSSTGRHKLTAHKIKDLQNNYSKGTTNLKKKSVCILFMLVTQILNNINSSTY